MASMSEKPNEIVEQIFSTAAADDVAKLVAAPLADAHASGRWEPAALDEVLCQLEEQS
jgi:hypothetical protein